MLRPGTRGSCGRDVRDDCARGTWEGNAREVENGEEDDDGCEYCEESWEAYEVLEEEKKEQWARDEGGLICCKTDRSSATRR